MGEQERLSQIGKDVDFIKRWWPVATFIGTALYFIITWSSNAQKTYDTKIAKKEDITLLSKQVANLSIQVSHLADDFKGYKTTYTKDSLERVVIKSDLEKHKKYVDNRLNDIAKRISALQLRFFTEKRIGNNLIITPVSGN
jgi:hypothetical protein